VPTRLTTRTCFVPELDAERVGGFVNTVPVWVCSLGRLVAQYLCDDRPATNTDSSSYLQRRDALVRISGILQTPLGIIGYCSRAHAIRIIDNRCYSTRSLKIWTVLMTHELASPGTGDTRQAAEALHHPPSTGRATLHKPLRPHFVLDTRFALMAHRSILGTSGSVRPIPSPHSTTVVEAKDPKGASATTFGSSWMAESGQHR
jgi:hypothetical protein